MFDAKNVRDDQVICSAVYYLSDPKMTLKVVSCFFGITLRDLKWLWRNRLPELDEDLYHQIQSHHEPDSEHVTCCVRNTPFGVNGVA